MNIGPLSSLHKHRGGFDVSLSLSLLPDDDSIIPRVSQGALPATEKLSSLCLPLSLCFPISLSFYFFLSFSYFFLYLYCGTYALSSAVSCLPFSAVSRVLPSHFLILMLVIFPLPPLFSRAPLCRLLPLSALHFLYTILSFSLNKSNLTVILFPF